MTQPTPPVGGGSRLSGVNQLQTSIDSLTQAVQGLTNRIGTPGPTGSNTSFSNAPGMNQTATGGNGSAAGSPGLFSNYPTFGQMTGGANGGFSRANSMATGAAGAIAGTSITGGLAAAQNFGSGQLGVMSGLSAYLAQGAVMGGNSNGLRSNITSLNDIANSANDLVSGQSLINYSSGAYGTQNALSRGITGAANMAGFLNPTLGFTGAASLGQQMYSQGMSMNMMMLGYGVTPRTMGGGTNSIEAVNQAILQRTFGGKSNVNQRNFQASAAPGGRLNYNLQALGLSGSDLTSTLNMLSAQNQLSAKGYTNSQIQGVFSGAASGNKGSVADLTKVFGANFTNNILQTLKNKTALGTQRSGEEESGYQTGLAMSVGLLNKFNSALNKLLSGPLGKFVGGVGGFGGSGILGDISHAIEGVSSGGILGGVSSILGGGAAGPTGATSNSASTGTTSKVNTGVSGAAKAAVSAADSQIGVPYGWGMEQPGVGFDCSGLTQYAYKRAGVNLPRTSQQQWASLSKGHSVGLNQVQEGDLVFTAGSDGTASAPGHVAMMVNNRTLIQAEETGTNIGLFPYNPGDWDHAARPGGPGSASMSSTGAAGPASGVGMASGGGGYSEGGSMGSVNESDAIGGAGGGYMSGMRGQYGTTGSSSSSGPSAGAAPGNPTGNAALGKQLAAQRGWTGTQWNDLYALWMRESGWSNTARNASSGAYGIAQALGHGPSNQYPAGQYLSANQPPTGSSDAKEQIMWGLNYIAGSYKNPAGAWAHEQSAGWYARGTQNSNKGMAVLGEQGPEAVMLPGGSQVMTAGQTAGLLAQIQSGQGKAVGGGSGAVITLNLSSGAIQVNGLSGGSDVSSSAREIASQIATYLAQEDIVKKLAMGVSS